MWRACKDILPTKENLQRRKVLMDSCCEACQMKIESSSHLFWLCSCAKEVRKVSKLFFGQLNLHFSSFMDLIWFVIMVRKWDATNIKKIIMIAWAIWLNRNRVRNGEEGKSCGMLVDFSLDYLREYQLCCEKLAAILTKEKPKWRPPQQGSYKVNVDNAVFATQRATGLGVLIKDVEGRVVGACSKKINTLLGALETEAKAFEFRLQFARDMMVHNLILEGDSLVIVNALKDRSPPPASVAAVLYNVLSVSHELYRVEFSHICRRGNWLAHLLAKHVCGITDFSMWVEENPYFIEQALLHNVHVAFHN